MIVWMNRGDKRNAPEITEVTERQPRRMRLAGVAGLALAGLIALSPAGGTLARQAGGNLSPARGHAQVVAQSVIQVDGPVSWELNRAEAGGAAAAEQLDGPGFLIGADGVVLITDLDTGGMQRLAAGEATAVRGGTEYELAAVGEEADFYELSLVDGGAEGRGALFLGDDIADLEGLRDLDLLRDSLKPKEKASLPAGEAPTLIFVTEGEVRVTVAGEDGSITLGAGEAAEFDGDVELQAGKEGRANFLAAVIGPAIDGDAEEATPRADDGGNGSGGGTGSSGGGQGAETGPVDYPDSDGDGLDDNTEAQIGTDPTSADTDQDGLSDGDEVNLYGSDPLSMDGDGDLLPDYNEVMQHGTNPMNPDSDGDSLNDHDELNYNTDPLNADSDGDGLLDGIELFTYPSDPLDTDSDDDGLLDGDEVNLYGSHPNNMDTDADGLPDYNEVMQHGTNPAVADTDADGINDHDELSYNTSLLDPDSDDDGALDGDEIFGGTDPLDPNSKP
ncbi:MAG: hypothetical protein IT336_17005 [Thermomicrobiales bacterium]|nr:hypothetical protein [Thermomicrobiales bacterium]